MSCFKFKVGDIITTKNQIYYLEIFQWKILSIDMEDQTVEVMIFETPKDLKRYIGKRAFWTLNYDYSKYYKVNTIDCSKLWKEIND